MNNSQDTVREFLKGLSTNDFLKIGMNEIAYVRPLSVGGIFSGGRKQAFAVYAAGGTQLSVLDGYGDGDVKAQRPSARYASLKKRYAASDCAVFCPRMERIVFSFCAARSMAQICGLRSVLEMRAMVRK